MTQNDHKQKEQTREPAAQPADDKCVALFNPWDEQFKPKPPGQEFEF